MLAALASPCRIKRNHRRRRRIASGRAVYAYALGNPISYADPFGLWVPPALPQGLVDYFSGYGSYYTGVGHAAEHLFWRSGLAGQHYQQLEICEEAILGAAVAYVSTHPKVAKEVWRLALQHKAYLSGRLSAGVVTSTVTGVGPYAGASIGTLAALGTGLDDVDNGVTQASGIVGGMIGSPTQ
jgi:hypothetical protein